MKSLNVQIQNSKWAYKKGGKERERESGLCSPKDLLQLEAV